VCVSWLDGRDLRTTELSLGQKFRGYPLGFDGFLRQAVMVFFCLFSGLGVLFAYH
jgi:hypothetical protein